MAIEFQFGDAFGTPVNKSLEPWDYENAVRIVQNDGTLVKMTDIVSPLDKQTSMKLTATRIGNVYNTLAGGTIPVSEQSSNTSGSSIFAELKTVATRPGAIDGTTVQLPMVGRIEVRLPNDASITEADVTTLVMAAFALLCDKDGDPTVVTEKMRGALAPCTC